MEGVVFFGMERGVVLRPADGPAHIFLLGPFPGELGIATSYSAGGRVVGRSRVLRGWINGMLAEVWAFSYHGNRWMAGCAIARWLEDGCFWVQQWALR